MGGESCSAWFEVGVIFGHEEVIDLFEREAIRLWNEVVNERNKGKVLLAFQRVAIVICHQAATYATHED
jgi:hypothetical protein